MAQEQDNGNPFHIFPEELWESVLEQLENSQDIHNVFTAFPQVTVTSRGREWSWLFDTILPHLFPKFLTFSDVKICRLVSKRWENAVGTSIETHPDRLPHMSPRITEITETHFNYRKLPYITTSLCKFTPEFYNGQVTTGSSKNPFPGRHVHVKVEDETLLTCQTEGRLGRCHISNRSAMTLNEAVPILKMFGHHIWYITFDLPCVWYVYHEFLVDKIVQPLFHCLSYLPNLKSLRLAGLVRAETESNEDRSKTFPELKPLPFRLETLDMSLWGICTEGIIKNIFHLFMKSFVNHDQVKKLVIKSDNWNKEYACLFPNLTELTLYQPASAKVHRENKTALNNILQDLCPSRIRKLKIQTSGAGMPVNYVLEELADYQIESLELDGKVEEEPLLAQSVNEASTFTRLEKYVVSFFKKPDAKPVNALEKSIENAVVPSIKCFKLRVHYPVRRPFYQCLKSLPYLEYLTIEIWSATTMYSFLTRENTEDAMPNDRFGRCIHNLYYNGQHDAEYFQFIWNEFPYLKMLTIYLNRQKVCYQYAREWSHKVCCTSE